MRRQQSWFVHLGIGLLLLGMASSAAAQLATRPAEEWSKTLDQQTRVESLKVAEIVAKLALKPGQVIADLGARTGLFSIPLAKAIAPGGRVYAVEIDQGFFSQINAKAKESGVTNIRTVLGEFKDPKLPGSDVDVAFMHDVLHHVEDRAAYLQNASRYVKPAGRFVIVDYRGNQGPHREQPDLIVSEEQVTGWMKSAGFNKVERVDLFADKYFLIFSR